MASYDDILKKQTQLAEQRAAEAAKASTAKQDALIADFTRQSQEAQGQVQKQIDNVPQQYQKQYDVNAVQELVNRRQLEEAMANAGLTRSGTNASNQTAISVMRGNADYETNRQKQAAVDALNQSLANLISQSQTQLSNIRIQTADEIAQNRQNLLSQAEQNAVKQYNAELEAQAAARQAAQQAALQQAQNQAKIEQQRESSFYSAVQKYLENNPDASASRAYSYAQSVSGYMPQSAQDTLKQSWSQVYSQYRGMGYNESQAAAYANNKVYGTAIPKEQPEKAQTKQPELKGLNKYYADRGW